MATESVFFEDSSPDSCLMVECDLGIENDIAKSDPENLFTEASLEKTNLWDIVCGTMNFTEEVYQRMLDCGMDVESLYYITDVDINELFPISMLGTRVKFKERVARWRRNGIQIPTDTVPKIVACKSLRATNLRSILKATERGQNIFKQFKETGTLSDASRKFLVNTIADHFTANDRAMTMKDIIQYSEQIVALFPNEDICYYYNRRKGKNPNGKLYDKATNHRRKMKKEPRV